MNCHNYYFVLCLGVLLGQASAASAQEAKKEFKLLIDAPDEAVAKQLSLAKAADFLDHQSRAWTQVRQSTP